MSQTSTDSYSYSGLNDLSSFHSNAHSFSAGGGTEDFHYDGSDMLYAWELSSRFNQHVSRGVRLEDLHLITASALPVPSTTGKAAHPPPPPNASNHAADNYLLENPFDQSTIHFDDYHPIKISSAAVMVPSSSSVPLAPRVKRAAPAEATITDDLLEQFQRGMQVSGSSNVQEESQSHFQQMMADYHHQNEHQIDCPERPFHLMKTHMVLKLAPPAAIPRLDFPAAAAATITSSPENKEAAVDAATPSSPDMILIDPVDTIVTMVTGCLSSFSEYDFSYFPKLYLWKGKYLRGSSSCLINIHLYRDKGSLMTTTTTSSPPPTTTTTATTTSPPLPPANTSSTTTSFIIEANRISGEARPFHDFFKSFKKMLLSTIPNEATSLPSGFNTMSSYASSSMASSFDEGDESGSLFYCSQVSTDLSGLGGAPISRTSSPLRKLSSGDFQKSIEPILNMTKCHFYEVKLEAAKMLCDVATTNCGNGAMVGIGEGGGSDAAELYLRDPKCLDQIFKAIETLIVHNDGFLAVKEQAIVAFASFLEPGTTTTANPQEVMQRMLKSPVLHLLLQLINNPANETMAYETAQMRRESARVLSILASYDAMGLLQSLEGHQVTGYALKRWFDNVDYLKDPRTRIYAGRIRELLTAAALQLSQSSQIAK